jgi:hypothetical protein
VTSAARQRAAHTSYAFNSDVVPRRGDDLLDERLAGVVDGVVVELPRHHAGFDQHVAESGRVLGDAEPVRQVPLGVDVDEQRLDARSGCLPPPS